MARGGHKSSPPAEVRALGAEHAALVRGLLTGFELAKSQPHSGAVVVDLPLNWRLEARCSRDASAADAFAVEETSVAAGITFSVRLPTGVEVRSWEQLCRALRELSNAPTPRDMAPATRVEEGVRRGNRKRLRPLEYWSNERESRRPDVEPSRRRALSRCS